MSFFKDDLVWLKQAFAKGRLDDLGIVEIRYTQDRFEEMVRRRKEEIGKDGGRDPL